MSNRDLSWREWERRWEANPGDQSTLQALITARLRAGLPIPGALLDQQIYTARQFESEAKFHVFCELPNGKPSRVGATPGPPVVIPRHRGWWVRPLDVSTLDKARLSEVVEELNAAGIPGLSLQAAPLENHELTPLAEARTLTHLSLAHCEHLSGPGLEHLSGLVDLVSLSLAGCERVTGGLRYLGHTALRRVELTDCELTPAGLDALASLERLTHIRLTGHPVSPHVLHRLAMLPELARIDLPRSDFEPDAIRQLSGAPALIELRVPWCDINDHHVKVLHELPHLRALDLSSCRKLTDWSLELLAQLPSLRELNLYGCDQIGNASLAFLQAFTRLRRLDLSHTKLTRSKVDALRKALPDCEVIATGRATGKNPRR